MDWLRPTGFGASASAVAAEEPDELLTGPVEQAAPGVAALLDGVREDRTHAVLDLGPAAGSSLRVYGRYARRIRFADLLAGGRSGRTPAPSPDALPAQPEQPYDLVFAWDVLDRIFPRQRPRLIRRLAEVSAPEARLHVVIGAAERETTRPLRFTLLDVDRMRCEPAGPVRPARRRLLPADVEDLLAPFEVVRGFTLRTGLREYVAVRGEGHDSRRW